MSHSRSKNPIGTIIAHVFLVCVCIIFIFPIYWLVTSAFKDSHSLWQLPPLWIPTSGLSQIWEIITKNNLLPFFLHSFVASVGSTAIVMVLASMLAYSLTRHNWKHRRTIASSVVSLKIMPPISVIIPMYLLYSNLRLYDTIIGLVLVYILFNLPLATWLLIGFFNQIPKTLDESAWIEGAGSVRTLWNIILPIARSGIIGVGAVSIMFAWNDYIFAVSLTSNRAVTLTVGAAGFLGDFIYQWSSFYTAGSMEIIPMLLIAVFLQRYLIRGLSYGVIKS